MESSSGVTGLVIVVFFAGVFALLGAVFTILAVRSRQKARAALAWPTVRGEVQSSQVREHSSYDSDDNSTSTSYEPVVQYTYAIMGQPFESGKIAYGATSFGRKQAEQVAARYPAGSTVQVRYNPEKPSEAVLETRATGMNVFLIVGVAFLVIAALAVCISAIVFLAA
jgi:hypothetical protein